MLDIGAHIRVGSNAECMDVDVNSAKSPVDMCSRYQQSEDSDDRGIILIQLFGGYSVSEVLHARVACAKNTREVLHARFSCANNTREVLHVACCMQDFHVCMQQHSKGTRSGQIDSFLVEREC